MGVSAGTEAEARISLAAFREAVLTEVLPPVLVVRREAAGFVSVPVANAAGRTFDWQVTLEDGSVKNGRATAEGGKFRIAELPFGYHRLRLEDPAAETALIVAPRGCWLPDGFLDGRQLWGVSVQLYLLQSARNWGIGDFADLAVLAEAFGEAGAAVIGLNPLHALFPDTPEEASPYSPASRLLLNVLSIAVDLVPEARRIPELQGYLSSDAFQESLSAARASRLVDYTAVTRLKMQALRALYDGFQPVASEERRAAFRTFREKRGKRFETSCLFLALRAHFADSLGTSDWHQWPDAFRRPDSDAVHDFARSHADAVGFQVFLQWLADEQLAEAARAAREAGMEIGLYRDLAVGADLSGAETWANAGAVLDGVEVGAPPDLFNPAGQSWGLPPFDPGKLRAEGYRSFIELVRANMRHAGGLRIDHVMGLSRLYCIPKGGDGTGAYLGYPMEDLIGILALESRRKRCLVVGEDLGTVPPGFRERMREANILSYRVLYFEKDEVGKGFASPDSYPRRSLAVASSHDLATLRGWYADRDVSRKQELGLYPAEGEAERQHALRDDDRAALLDALRANGFLPGEGEPTDQAFVDAAHAFLNNSASGIAVAQLDDLTGELDQVNVPATRLEYPNWRRKYSKTLEAFIADGTVSRAGRLFSARSTRTKRP
nr:4-alpha-glucanotransferase [Chthonobacter albigriseus]